VQELLLLVPELLLELELELEQEAGLEVDSVVEELGIQLVVEEDTAAVVLAAEASAADHTVAGHTAVVEDTVAGMVVAAASVAGQTFGRSPQRQAGGLQAKQGHEQQD